MHVSQITNKDVSNTQRQLKQAQNALYRARECMQAVRDNLGSLIEIKQAIATGDTVYAEQLWDEIGFREQKALMLAPRKGGFFTTQERAIIKNLWSVSIEDVEGCDE